MSDTFCILPWIHLAVFPEGSSKICCVAGDRIASNGIPLSLQSQDVQAVWNSQHLRAVRSDMVAGRAVRDCAHCYHMERTLGASHRTESNTRWRAELGPAFDTTVQESTRRGHVVSSLPIYYQLMPGNRCNLKCRMCFPIFSSGIERDEVHRGWSPSLFEAPAPRDPTCGAETGHVSDAIAADGARLPSGPWYRDDGWVRDVLLAAPETLRSLYFTGGEPMIEPQVEKILDHLIARGVAGDVVLEINTNATVLKEGLLDKLERFRKVYLGLSIDAHGAEYEYIRYPAKWAVVRRNVERLVERRTDTLQLSAVSVLQTYNALNIVRVLEFFDEMRIPFTIEIASLPWFLSISILPARIRRLAAERLRTYGTGACRPESRAHVDAIARCLEEVEDGSRADALRTFMLFTNDLDAGRAQSFRQVHSEFVALLREHGFEWADDRCRVAPETARTHVPVEPPAGGRFRSVRSAIRAIALKIEKRVRGGCRRLLR